MKRLFLAVLGVVLLALPLYAASVGKVSGVTETNCGKVSGLAWQTGTQTLGAVNGLTADGSVPAHTYYASSDALIGNNDNDWDTVHDGVNGGGGSIINSTGVYLTENAHIIIGYNIQRSFLYFDTSSIPAGATIIEAKLYLYGASNPYNTDIQVYEGTQADTLTTDDFDNYGSAWSSNIRIVVGQYNVITLNSTALSGIAKGGTTKICLRQYDHDVLDVAPLTGVYIVSVYSIDQEGTDKDPYLSVSYTEE